MSITDQNRETIIIENNTDFEWLIYSIGNEVSSFMLDLVSNSSLICSSRAHGVWLPTLVGMPVLSVAIENKLVEVCKTLGKCSAVTHADNIDKFRNDFDSFKSNLSYYTSQIKDEVSVNYDLSKESRNQFLSWLKHE